MPWWDNTNAYNDASGWPREWMTYGQDQMKRALDQARNYGYNADWIQQQLQDYYWNQMNTPYASPQDIYATGSAATPWINDGIDAMAGQANGVNDMWTGRPTVGSLYDPIYGRFNDWAGDIGRTGEDSQREIDTLAQTLGGWNEGTNRDVMSGIGDTFSRVDSGINDTFSGLRRASGQTGRDLLNATNQSYGGLRSDSDSTFGGLTNSLDQTFSGLQGRTGDTFSGLQSDLGGTTRDIQREIERLRPNSDFAMGRASRAWAPMVANTAQRLRTLGLTPNSLQGMSAMSDVEARRSAAMDDSAIEQNLNVADRLNQMQRWGFDQRAGLGIGELDRMTDLGIGQQAGRERLNIGALMNRQGLTEREQGIGRGLVTDALMRDIDLGIGQNDRSNQSALAALAASNAERLRNLGNMQDIASQRTGNTLNNLNTSFDRTRDWRTNLNATDVDAYNANMQDIFANRNMADWNNQNTMRDIGLRNQQYGIGNEWWQNDYARRDAGAANMGGLMNNQYDQRQQATSNAMGWGNSAMNSANTARNYDANRGNIGTRLLGGIAGPLLGMIPGVGPALQGGVNAITGALTGQPGQGQNPFGPQNSGGGGGGRQSSGSNYVMPRYSNSAVYPQVAQWNNFGQNMFGNMRIP